MLSKNTVRMEDTKGSQFDNLIYLVRPETNKKFIGIFNLKTAAYASHQPKIDRKTGEIKDSRFNRWMRESIGEPPVLLDSTQIENSMDQILLAMRKMGYFDAAIHADVVPKESNAKKVQVNYHVTANPPYFIREVNYHVAIPEFRKIILLDSANRLFREGDQYNENAIVDERNRIANLIRNQGYYYVTNSIITMEIDTFDASGIRDKKGRKTLSVDIQVNFNDIRSEELRERMLYRYRFDKVFIYTNYNIQDELNTEVDTVLFRSYRNKKDSTLYYFITPRKVYADNKKDKIFKDFKYKTLTDVIYTKKGWLYSQSSYDRSYRRLNDLRNFNIINIEFLENISKRDSILRNGILDVRYRLTRSKLHSIATELNVRSDKSSLSFTYANKNLFKGAERLTVNLYGSVSYYNWLKKDVETIFYGDLGGSISLEFPRLFIFKQTQRIEALRYSTSITFGANYSWLFARLMMNAGMTYNWSPNYNISHSLSPIMISTIDTSQRTIRSTANYPESYRRKFDKNILFSLKYTFNYLVPTPGTNHNLRFTVDLESSGMLLTGLNSLFNKINRHDNVWEIAGYNYATYEIAEFNLRYNYIFNKNNSIASRFNIGIAVPFFHSRTIPFEKSFYLGGANSMRAWGFRALGPGSYYSSNYIERTGDLKLEMNLEYRGTIYKSFKYGIFVDMGNIWLLREHDDMPRADFKWGRFYKEIGIGVGVGLRLDFNFFLLRLDYGVPIYNPSMPEADKYWINSRWLEKRENGRLWNWGQGFQFAIGHAF